MLSVLLFVLCIVDTVLGQKCTVDVLSSIEYVGCFVDTPDRLLPARDLENDFDPYLDNNKCVLRCKDRRFMFAGTEAWNQCYCGNDPWRRPAAANEVDCSFTCTGDGSQMCGGGWRLSVYRTGWSNVTSQESTELFANRRFNAVSQGSRINDTKPFLSSHFTSRIKCASLCLQDGVCTGFVYSAVIQSCNLYQLKFEDHITTEAGSTVYIQE